MLSHSMIDMNSTSAKRKPAFGKLDSMARKVSTGFKDDVSNEKSTTNASTPASTSFQSTIPQRSSLPQKMPSTFAPLEKHYPQENNEEQVTKKRR